MYEYNNLILQQLRESNKLYTSVHVPQYFQIQLCM